MRKILIVTVFLFIWTGQGLCAVDLDKAKVCFLRGDYAGCIHECEEILESSDYSKDLDELYYLLGLSYLKVGNHLRASDIFEIILKEFKESRFIPEAKLGLADSYFFTGNYPKAQELYKEIISLKKGKLTAEAYQRLSQCALKIGRPQEAREYLDKLKKEFPFSAAKDLDQDASAQNMYYTVQVGYFSNPSNAAKLTRALVKNGYPAYTEETGSGEKKSYRVRVGKYSVRQEAAQIEIKLSREGYPTKLFP